MNTIPERLKILRGKDPQESFSAKIGLKQTTLGRYERGESSPDAEALQRICKTLQISPRWLLLGEGPMGADETPPFRPSEEVEALKKRIAELETENAELLKEAKELYKEAFNAYKRLYEVLPVEGPNGNTHTGAPACAPSAPSFGLTNDK